MMMMMFVKLNGCNETTLTVRRNALHRIVLSDTICNGVDDQGCGNVMVEHAVVHGAERRYRSL